MPFFYSQYLRDEKPRVGGCGGVRINAHPSPQTASSGANQKQRPSVSGTKSRSFRKPGALVWHSGTGSSGKTAAQEKFKPLGYNSAGKRKKAVHFSTIEVQPFYFDWNNAKDIFYTKAELTDMGQSRFDDAANLRQQRRLDGRKKSSDDVGISKKSKDEEIASLLAMALEDADQDDNVSIRGIEHFVYPGLQQEMIRRKKEAQKEVLAFVRSKRPDPQGWRLAEHSRSLSTWAKNVALEKGMKYCMNNAAVDPEACISDEELERFHKSQEELDCTARSLKGSLSYGGKESASFESKNTRGSVLHEIAEGAKQGDSPYRAHESQPAGSSTGEG